jgi:hypothetical protein
MLQRSTPLLVCLGVLAFEAFHSGVPQVHAQTSNSGPEAVSEPRQKSRSKAARRGVRKCGHLPAKALHDRFVSR